MRTNDARNGALPVGDGVAPGVGDTVGVGAGVAVAACVGVTVGPTGGGEEPPPPLQATRTDDANNAVISRRPIILRMSAPSVQPSVPRLLQHEDHDMGDDGFEPPTFTL